MPLKTKTKQPNQAKHSPAFEQTAEPEASTPSAQTAALDLATEAVQERVERAVSGKPSEADGTVQEAAKAKGKPSIVDSKGDEQAELRKAFNLPGGQP